MCVVGDASMEEGVKPSNGKGDGSGDDKERLAKLPPSLSSSALSPLLGVWA